jgi:hypothetical protein
MNKIELIGISAKISHGKDTVGQMILDMTGFEKDSYESPFRVRKFADKLKEIVALLIGVSRADLEKDEVKNMTLPEDWDRFMVYNHHEDPRGAAVAMFATEEEARAYVNDRVWPRGWSWRKESMTPRLLLQLMGTECGRNILHPNIWINATFADWNPGMQWIITDTRRWNRYTGRTSIGWS